VPDYLSKIGKQISDFFSGLSFTRKIALTATLVGVIVGLFMLFSWAAKTAYSPLMTNLNPEDSSNIMRVLREKNVPFEVDSGGRIISVPTEMVNETRMALATLGMPQNSVVGYEVFDKQTLGTTSFVQKLNQRRAREGELMRTINSIRGVKRSRVHLAIPERATFVEDQKKPTASVILDLEPGVQLAEKQLFGISNLVGRAVEGLDPSDVAIVDSNGKMLTRSNHDPISALTANQLEIRGRVERDMESRIEDMLSRVVGAGRVVARVSADMDFSQVNETQTLYDQEGAAVRSSEKNNQSMEGSRPGPRGPAGAVANTPGNGPELQAATPEIRNNTNRVNEVVNYAVPQTIRTTTRSPGSIRKLSVAVVVDGRQVKVPGKDGEPAVMKTEAWSAQKLQEFEAVVAGAVALDRKRGDTLEIKNMEFTREDLDLATAELDAAEKRRFLQKIASFGVIGILGLLFFLFVVRPSIKWVTENTIDSVDSFLPQTIEELEKLQKGNALAGMEDIVPQMPESLDPEKVEGEMIREKLVTMIEGNPHKAALIVKDWLHATEVGGRKKPGDDKVDAAKPKGA
jgi:flagellar M-ring protein FliF